MMFFFFCKGKKEGGSHENGKTEMKDKERDKDKDKDKKINDKKEK
jgi:hypothetical protein